MRAHAHAPATITARLAWATTLGVLAAALAGCTARTETTGGATAPHAPPRARRAPLAAPRLAARAPHAGPGPADSPPPRPADAAATDPDPLYQSDGEDAPADDVPETDDEQPPAESAAPSPNPLDGLKERQIEQRLTDNPASLGSMSIGRPGAGALFNGVQMPTGEHWVLEDPAHTWGTRETVDYLITAIDAVSEQFPDTPRMYIGHISARHGGHLSPHVSHQAGRDVDVSYYYLDGARWYARATAKNLDRARTWAFVRAIITRTDVQLILMDRSVQRLVKDYALSIGEDAQWLDELFRGRPGKLRPIIIHVPGHATHIHVRFYNPVAQESGRRAYRALVEKHLIHTPTWYVPHTVKKGETLGMLARKYHTTVAAIRKANGLRSNLIVARKTYRIPQQGGAAIPRRVVVPQRRLPPGKRTASRASSGDHEVESAE